MFSSRACLCASVRLLFLFSGSWLSGSCSPCIWPVRFVVFFCFQGVFSLWAPPRLPETSFQVSLYTASPWWSVLSGLHGSYVWSYRSKSSQATNSCDLEQICVSVAVGAKLSLAVPGLLETA